MVREICRDIFFLSQKSVPAATEDLAVGQDLLETLEYHKDGCVGMAANMIGVAKKIIAFDCDGSYMVMYNPEIIKKARPYETEEGCLSLEGRRKTTRFETIKVRYQNEHFQERLKTFSGFTAQIIQHEVDHLNGVVI